MPAKPLSEPWRSFLLDLDNQLDGETELHCLGGFIVAEYYGLTRPTGDIDVIEAVGAASLKTLAQLAGKGSNLEKTHHVYLDIVTVATVPENYEARLIDVYQGIELLTTGRLSLPMRDPERSYLLEVRRGKVSEQECFWERTGATAGNPESASCVIADTANLRDLEPGSALVRDVNHQSWPAGTAIHSIVSNNTGMDSDDVVTVRSQDLEALDQFEALPDSKRWLQAFERDGILDLRVHNEATIRGL